MQIKNNFWNSDKKRWLIFLKLSLFVTAVFFVVDRFQDQSIDLRYVKLPDEFPSVFSLVVVLMLVNWSLEGWRWKVSVEQYEPISFVQSMKIVLHGLALNLLIPFTAGDAVARIVPMKDKYQTTSAMILNRTIMLLITLTFGIYGLYTFTGQNVSIHFLVPILLAVLAICTFIFRDKLERFLDYFRSLNHTIVMKVLGLSVVRYLVFVTQFLLLLGIFLPEISVLLLVAGTGWIFFVRSVLPSLIGGIGIREASAVLFFDHLVGDMSMVVVPIFMLWLLNTLLPSVIGLIAILKLKVKIAG